MKCLVTGGAGFIGSHLCDRLLADGHRVVCVDNFITGHKENISAHLGSPHFEFFELDASEPLPADIGAHAIFHFASPASPPKYQKYAIETLLVNTVGTYHLLERAREWNAKFIFASTSEIYGDPLEHPQKETYWGNVNPNGPRACYDEAKRAGEAFVATYIRKYNVDARMIRIFNTFGPRMDLDDGRVVTNFFKQMLSGESVTIYGDGKQTRSFCYVSDLVDGIMRVLNNEKAKHEIFNLGNPDEMTVKKLADFMGEMLGYKGEYVYSKLPQDDPLRRKPSIAKAKKILGWEPKVTLQEGIKKTWKHLQAKQS